MTPVIFRTSVNDVLFFLINRAAMKMANMDSAFDFMFTNPKNDRGVRILMKHFTSFDSVINPRALNPLYPSISKHILHTVL